MGTYFISPYLLCVLLSYQFGFLSALLLGRRWNRAAEVDAPCRIGALLRLPCSVYKPLGNPPPNVRERISLFVDRHSLIFHSYPMHLFVWVPVRMCLFCADTLQSWWAFPLGLNANRFYRLGGTQTTAVGEVNWFWAASIFNWKASDSVWRPSWSVSQ